MVTRWQQRQQRDPDRDRQLRQLRWIIRRNLLLGLAQLTAWTLLLGFSVLALLVLARVLFAALRPGP